MQEIWIHDSRILLWPGIHAEAGENIRVFSDRARKAFILTDKNCVPIATRVAMSLQQMGIEVYGCAIPVRATRLGIDALPKVQERMARQDLEIGSAFISVGGGPVAEVGAAATFAHPSALFSFLIPTTLRAMVDSSVGGILDSIPPAQRKARLPKAVLTDPTVLDTLPLREYLGGLADVVRYAMVQDAELLTYLEKEAINVRDRMPRVLEEMIYRCASIKAAVAEREEKGAGIRLEYGRTFARGLRTAVGPSVHAGEILSLALEAECALALDLKITTPETAQAQNRVLKHCGLPTRIGGITADRLFRAVEQAYKGAPPPFVLAEAPGKVRYPVQTTAAQRAKALGTLVR